MRHDDRHREQRTDQGIADVPLHQARGPRDPEVGLAVAALRRPSDPPLTRSERERAAEFVEADPEVQSCQREKHRHRDALQALVRERLEQTPGGHYKFMCSMDVCSVVEIGWHVTGERRLDLETPEKKHGYVKELEQLVAERLGSDDILLELFAQEMVVSHLVPEEDRRLISEALFQYRAASQSYQQAIANRIGQLNFVAEPAVGPDGRPRAKRSRFRGASAGHGDERSRAEEDQAELEHGAMHRMGREFDEFLAGLGEDQAGAIRTALNSLGHARREAQKASRELEQQTRERDREFETRLHELEAVDPERLVLDRVEGLRFTQRDFSRVPGIEEFERALKRARAESMN